MLLFSGTELNQMKGLMQIYDAEFDRIRLDQYLFYCTASFIGRFFILRANWTLIWVLCRNMYSMLSCFFWLSAFLAENTAALMTRVYLTGPEVVTHFRYRAIYRKKRTQPAAFRHRMQICHCFMEPSYRCNIRGCNRMMQITDDVLLQRKL